MIELFQSNCFLPDWASPPLLAVAHMIGFQVLGLLWSIVFWRVEAQWWTQPSGWSAQLCQLGLCPEWFNKRGMIDSQCLRAGLDPGALVVLSGSISFVMTLFSDFSHGDKKALEIQLHVLSGSSGKSNCHFPSIPSKSFTDSLVCG